MVSSAPPDGAAERDVLESQSFRVSAAEWETFGKIAKDEHRSRGSLIRQYIQRRNAEITEAAA
jgi:hypothetical protein